MPIPIGPYQLSDKTANKMRQFLERTKIQNIELGFTLCKSFDSNTIIDRSDCTGDNCKIKLDGCNKGELRIGGFHTHPEEYAIMTAGDMRFACKEDVECIGGVRDNRIVCFLRQRDPKNDITVQNDCALVANRIRTNQELPLNEQGRRIDELLRTQRNNVTIYRNQIENTTNRYFRPITINPR